MGSDRGLLTCFPDTDLTTAKELMEAKGIKQLPVVKRGVGYRTDRKRKPIGLLHYDSIGHCLRLVFFFLVIFQLYSFFH
jgi:CBS domain-containing protein